LQDPAEHRIAQRAHEPVWLERLEVERRETRVGVMRELPLRDPHFCRLRVALMEVHDGLPVRREARIRVQPRVADHGGTTERGNVDAVQVVPHPLLDYGVDTFGVGTPRVGAHGEGPSPGRFDDVSTFRLSILPSDEHQPYTVRLE